MALRGADDGFRRLVGIVKYKRRLETLSTLEMRVHNWNSTEHLVNITVENNEDLHLLVGMSYHTPNKPT